MKLLPRHQNGFTLVELLIATTVFSVILMAAASALTQVGRMYYKGVITAKTQAATRTVMDDVSRTIQFSNGSMEEVDTIADDQNPQPPIKAICLGSTRYTFVEGAQVNESLDGTYDTDAQPHQIRHVLWQDKIGAERCETDLPQLQYANVYHGAANSDREGQELLSNGMRLQTFTVTPLDSEHPDGDAFKVTVKVVYGDDDLLDNVNNPTSCKGSVVGGQWCAISELSSVVYSRAE